MKQLIILASASLLLGLAGCATQKAAKYSIYDASQGSSAKGCVDFYSTQPASGLKHYATSIYLYNDQGGKKFIGRVGDKVTERIRCILPPGEHRFRHGASPVFKTLTVNVLTNEVIPVDVSTTVSPVAMIGFGLIGTAASERCKALVGAPQPWNPDDYEWVSAKAR